ncbi:MAG: slipin family protein [Thiotrichaceae bacterium]
MAHKVSLEVHDLSQPEFKHRLTDFLLKTYPKEVEHYFTVVELGAHQLALVYKNGQLAEILPPSTRTCYWKGFIEITVELIDITTDFAIPADKINTLLRAQSATLQSQVKTAVFYQEIPEHHVGLLSVDGQCVQVLPTGLHAYWNFNRKITAEIYDLAAPEFKHRLANFRLEDYPAEIVSYFTQIELNAHQVALVYRNGVLADILPPSTRATYWKGVIEITVELIDISVNFTLPLNQATMLAHTQSKRLNTQVESSIYVKEVPEYHLGLLYVEGQYVETLAPGLHAYWRFNRNIKITTVDIRLQEIEVSRQEILTKDKVGLRINLSARLRTYCAWYRRQIEPQDYLYRELQFGLRAMVGTRTLDELLENKTIIDEAVFAYIQNKVNEFGIEVRSVGVKDIILPAKCVTF